MKLRIKLRYQGASTTWIEDYDPNHLVAPESLTHRHFDQMVLNPMTVENARNYANELLAAFNATCRPMEALREVLDAWLEDDDGHLVEP
jgi:hypothetical protein